MHDIWRSCCWSWAINYGQKETNTITALTTLPPWRVSAPMRQCMMVFMVVYSESLWAFRESCTANESWSEHLRNGGRWEDKSTHNSSTKVSFSTNLKIIRFGQNMGVMVYMRIFADITKYSNIIIYSFTHHNFSPTRRGESPWLSVLKAGVTCSALNTYNLKSCMEF